MTMPRWNPVILSAVSDCRRHVRPRPQHQTVLLVPFRDRFGDEGLLTLDLTFTSIPRWKEDTADVCLAHVG